MNFAARLLMFFLCVVNIQPFMYAQTSGPYDGTEPSNMNAPTRTAGVGTCDASNYDALASQYFSPQMRVYINSELFYYMTDEGEFINVKGKDYPRTDETYQKFLLNYTEGFVDKLKYGREKFSPKDTLKLIFEPDPKMLEENLEDMRFQMFNIVYIKEYADGGVSDAETLMTNTKIGNGKLQVDIPIKMLPQNKVLIEIGCINRIDKNDKYYQIQWPMLERQRYVELDLTRH